MRIMLVEDDRALAANLMQVLRAAGFLVEQATDGDQAAYLGCTEDYDAAVLDLGLPGQDGISVLRHWREQGRRFPVLILTGRGRWSDKLAGFGAGADDYLTKPFIAEEVALRLHVLLRRSHGHVDSQLKVGPLCYDTQFGRFSVDGRLLQLTAQEQRILAYLMHHPDTLVSRSQIAEHVYERDLDPDSNTVDVLIGRIRRKLERPLIHTVRGMGFRLSAGDDPGVA